MSIDELISDEPRTRPCRVCAVEINAGSARCPYCGARQFKRQPILGWRGALVCLILVAAAVLVTRAITQRSHSSVSYAAYRSADLAALVPAGYKDLFLSGPHGTALVGWRDPANVSNTETVRATRPATGTPNSRTAALAGRLRSDPGVALGYHGRVVFPGGQIASELEYTNGPHLDAAVFAFDACNRTIAVTVTITTTRQTLLNELQEVIPQSANAICDGPDFSGRDPSNPSIPLSLRH